MDVVMASIYAVCAFAVGFAFGVVASRLVQGQKLKQAQEKAKALALKEVADYKKASVLTSDEPKKEVEVTGLQDFNS